MDPAPKTRMDARILKKMRSDWNDRAKENAQYYVQNAQRKWDQRDFFRSGEINVANEVMTDMVAICGGQRSPLDLRMLEIGCGVGRMTRMLARIFGHVTGIDISEEMVRQAIELDRRQRKLTRDANPGQDNAAYIDSLGWVFFRQGKLEEACRQLELASSLPDGVDDPTVWDHLGDVYFRLERRDRARAAWEKAVSLFEKENRRKMDERHEEALRKLKTLE